MATLSLVSLGATAQMSLVESIEIVHSSAEYPAEFYWMCAAMVGLAMMAAGTLVIIKRRLQSRG